MQNLQVHLHVVGVLLIFFFFPQWVFQYKIKQKQELLFSQHIYYFIGYTTSRTEGGSKLTYR